MFFGSFWSSFVGLVSNTERNFTILKFCSFLEDYMQKVFLLKKFFISLLTSLGKLCHIFLNSFYFLLLQKFGIVIIVYCFIDLFKIKS